jgi:branched-chain amino acid transport system ATP-binding protein
MKVIMSLSHRIVVLNFGEKIAQGTPQEVAHNPAVLEAYLGEEASGA